MMSKLYIFGLFFVVLTFLVGYHKMAYLSHERALKKQQDEDKKQKSAMVDRHTFAYFHNITPPSTNPSTLDWTTTNIEFNFSVEPIVVGTNWKGEWVVHFK